MSTRTGLKPHAVITAGNMASASITSEATVLQSLSCLSYEVSWTGTSPVGTLALQVSNSYTVAPAGGTGAAGTWTTVPLEVSGAEVTSIPVSGNTGNGFIDVTLNAGYAMRLVYTKGSGTGTLNATVVGKVS